MEFRALFHVEIVWLENFGVVDYLRRTLKSLHQLTRPLPELHRQLLIKHLQLRHVKFQEVIATLSIIPQLLPVNVNVILLGLPDKVHEFVLGIMLIEPVVIVLDVVVYQVLIRVVDRLAFKSVHRASSSSFSK